MSQVFVYGKLHCRGDDETIKGKIDIADIDAAIAFGKRNKAGEDIDDEFSTWMEGAMFAKYSHHLCALLGGLYNDSFESVNGVVWFNERTLQVVLEEYEFGVGLTDKAAKAEWVEAQE